MDTRFHVVGIYAPASKSGKTTAAKYLRQAFGFAGVSFADPIKRLALRFLLNFAPLDQNPAAAYEWAQAYFEHKERAIGEIPGSPRLRDILEGIGEGLRERGHPDVWVAIAQREIARRRASGARGVVLDDVRRPNEALLVRRLGGIMVQIHRPGVEPVPRAKTEGQLANIAWDATILNAGSKGDLFKLVTGRVGELLNLSSALRPD